MFDEFVKKVRHSVTEKATAKGYRPEDSDELLNFVARMGFSHAEGEILYKLVRYHARHDPEDLEKICGWAYLEWKRLHTR